MEPWSPHSHSGAYKIACWETLVLQPDGMKWKITDKYGRPVQEAKPVPKNRGIPLITPDTGDSKCWVEKRKYCVTQEIAGIDFTNCGIKLVTVCVNIDSTDGRS